MMASAKSVATDGGSDHLHFVVNNAASKYVCFTSCEKEDWIIHVTNGIDVWRLPLDKSKLESHRELADVSSYDAYFSRFSHAFKIGDLSVSAQGHKVVLMVGSGSTGLSYDLYEGTANERKADIQRALFFFAEQCSELQKKLTALDEELTHVKKQRAHVSDQSNALSDFELKKSSGNQARVVKQQGLSIVNPTSKKRKAAKGVEFE